MLDSIQKLDFLLKRTLGRVDSKTGRGIESEKRSNRFFLASSLWAEGLPPTRPSVLNPDTSSNLDISENVQLLKDIPLQLVKGSDLMFSYSGIDGLMDNIIPKDYGDGSYYCHLKDAEGAYIHYGTGGWFFDEFSGSVRFYDENSSDLDVYNLSFITITCYKYIGSLISDVPLKKIIDVVNNSLLLGVEKNGNAVLRVCRVVKYEVHNVLADGSVFNLNNIGVTGTLEVFVNGKLSLPNIDFEYIQNSTEFADISDIGVNFFNPRTIGDIIVFNYTTVLS